jgi:hypothetical protein
MTKQHTNMRTTWGHWKYDGKRFLLNYKNGRFACVIDLDGCYDSAAVLAWIMLTRTDAKDLVNLVRALGDILDPDNNMCSNGESRTINPRQVAESHGYKSGKKVA